MVGKLGDIDPASGSLFPGLSLPEWQLHPRQAFEAWLAGEVVVLARQFRDNSIATYRTFFAAWITFLESRHTGFLEATHVDAADFFATHPLDLVSRRRYLQLIDRVYRSLRTLGWTGDNPMARELRKERKLETKEPESLSDPEVDRLWAALDLVPEWKGVRDRALLGLLVGAGLRSNEVAGLPRSAVLADFRVRIEPQGVHRLHFSLILPGPARAAWLDWDARRVSLGVPGDRAFPSTKSGKLYTDSGLFRRIDTWLSLAGIAREERGANLLRNTFARRALALHPPEAVKEFLGHEEIRATLRHAAA